MVEGNTLEYHRSLVQEGHKRKCSIDNSLKELCGSGTDTKQKLQQIQLQYSELKRTLRDEQFKYFMFDEYKTDLPVTKDDKDCPTNADLKRVSETLTSFKQRLDDCRESREEIAEELQTLYDEFDTSLQTLEEILQDYQTKRQKLSETYKISSDVLESGLGSKTEELREKEHQLQQTRGLVRESLRSTQIEVNELQLLVTESRYVQEQIQAQKEKSSWKLIEWCSMCCQALETLAGLEDRGVDRTGWRVALKYPTLPPADTDLCLELKMRIDWQGTDQPQLTGVEVDMFDEHTQSIIDKSVADNDILYLLSSLRENWLSQYTLLSELHSIRQKFAVDWLAEHRSLHVIMCNKSDVLCVLKVADGYPGPGTVSLDSVKNFPDHDLASLKSSAQDLASLTEWLEFLHRTLEDKTETHTA